MNQRDKPHSSDEPGTEGPDGPLDDQPQREDEYLSHVLNEFNPQRKDDKTPLPASRKQKKPDVRKQGDDSDHQKSE